MWFTLRKLAMELTWLAHIPLRESFTPSPVYTPKHTHIHISLEEYFLFSNGWHMFCLTQLMRTYFGRPELGSSTRQKAYITFPLLSSSTISSRPPSVQHTVLQFQSSCPDKCSRTKEVSLSLLRWSLTSLLCNTYIITISFISKQCPVKQKRRHLQLDDSQAIEKIKKEH